MSPLQVIYIGSGSTFFLASFRAERLAYLSSCLPARRPQIAAAFVKSGIRPLDFREKAIDVGWDITPAIEVTLSYHVKRRQRPETALSWRSSV